MPIKVNPITEEYYERLHQQMVEDEIDDMVGDYDLMRDYAVMVENEIDFMKEGVI